MIRVKGHTSKRGNKSVRVSPHNRNTKYRSVNSSFIEAISESEEGGYLITINGIDFPYPELPNSMVSGLVKIGGKYYNKYIRGRHF